MWVSKIPSHFPKRNLFTYIPTPDKKSIKNEYNRFIISMSKVFIFSSILWGFESYSRKKECIQRYQIAIDSFYTGCLINKNISRQDCLQLLRLLHI